jgi:hypothetical protein
MSTLDERIEGMKPSEVCALISDAIRKHFGNSTQDAAYVSAAHGYYFVRFTANDVLQTWTLRRRAVPSLLKDLRAIAGGKLRPDILRGSR